MFFQIVVVVFLIFLYIKISGLIEYQIQTVKAMEALLKIYDDLLGRSILEKKDK